MDGHMRFYDAARKVPAEACKSFNNGRFKGTDINPMWRIKKLTELFGPAGIGWYYEIISERSERLTDDMIIAIVDLNLYIKDGTEWSKPIFGTGGNTLVSKTKSGIQASDEGYKMALTDALSVACKALGIGADVYFEKDTTKYTNASQALSTPGSHPLPPDDVPCDTAVPTPITGPRMAEPVQIDYLVENANEAQFMAMMNMYGLGLENMTWAQAEKLIQKLKGEKAS